MPETITPIYQGRPEDFHWVGFGSGSGTNLRECAKVIKPVLIFSDKPSWNISTKKGAKVAETDRQKLREYGLESLIDVPRLIINGFDVCGSSKTQTPEEYEKKSLEFNRKLVDELHCFEDKNGFGIDLIVLGGYMRLVGEPLLRAYPNKIINVHPAKLSLVTYKGAVYDLSDQSQYQRLFDKTFKSKGLTGMKRTFVGEDAVYDALRAGQKSTCSSVIMVDGGVDHGEIIAEGLDLGVWYEYPNGQEAEKRAVERKYATAHQELQKIISDHPALTMTLKLIAEGRVALGPRDTKSIGGMHFNEWRFVFLDGKQQPYDGCFINYATQKAVG